MGIMLQPLEIPSKPDAIDEGVYRWSDVVPPQSALTFAVLWDPEEDLVVFSQPDIRQEDFDKDISSHYLGLPPHEHLAELRSVTISSLASSPRSSRFDLLEEQHEDLFGPYSREQRSLRGMTQTSSTLGGLDVYLKGAALAKTHQHQPNYSILTFNTDLDLSLDPPCCETNANIYLTYLARGNFSQHGLPVSVPQVQRISGAWSSIESPTEEELALDRFMMDRYRKSSRTSTPTRRRRRLKKRRPSEVSTTGPRTSTYSPSSRRSPSPTLADFLVGTTRSMSALRDVWSCGKPKKIDRDDWVLVER
ncbi:hypothetical protein NLJ89_g8228 [Agrocybe chaxingu]|uniref:Uncharacterized protein n=1 Tax=Agrocybe chaxingu TaxID=84603 RepID=A0A9W8MQZ6_9AGAR|nr:hypothetical protein NLJ89_g8228 [Agrocybe chaxingu]